MICFHRQAALFLEDGSGPAGGMNCFLVKVTLTAQANSNILQWKRWSDDVFSQAGGVVP